MAENLIDNLKKSGPTKLFIYIGVAALVVAGLVVLLLWSQGAEYRTLYSGLSTEDMSAVLGKLKEKRIPYRVDGNVVSVPSDKVYEVRIELAGEGLPQGGAVGFEIFDKTGFGVTEFVQKVNYRRALQGELARTIAQIQEVSAARVHLALPERDIFLDDTKRPRASIVLKLIPGASLSAAQVRGIVHLVSSSLEDLRPEDVTIVDTTGKLWTNPADDDSSAVGLTVAQFEYKRSLEADMERRIQTMLEKAVGPGKVVARVSTELDTTHVEKTEETYDPDSQVVRSEQRSQERTVGVAQMSGVPGVLSNTPGQGDTKGASSVGLPTSQKQDEIINYEISKVISRVVEPLGEIKRLTVSVLVDGNYEVTEGPEGETEKKYVPRSEEEIQKFVEIVKGIVGYTEDRGDMITVESVPFETAALVDIGGGDMEEASSFIPSFLVPYIPTIIKSAVAGVVAIFLIFFVLRPIIKRITEETRALSEIEATITATGPKALESGEGEDRSELEIKDEMERIKEMVRRNPRQAATIIRSWLKDR